MRGEIASLIILLLLFSTEAAAEKKFSITSDPSGAKVELGGKIVGTTPVEVKLKDYFFNGPKYTWSDWLGSPIQITVSKS